MTDSQGFVNSFCAVVERMSSYARANEAGRQEITAAAENLIKAFMASSREERTLMRTQLTYAARDSLVVFASRLTIHAEEANLPDLTRQKLIRNALGAMALVDKGNDVRDSICVLNGIRDVVQRLNLSPELLSEAANFNDNGELRRTFLNLSWGRGPNPISG